MNFKLAIFTALIATAAVMVLAETQKKPHDKDFYSPEKIAERKQAFLRRQGGFVTRPNSGSGKVVFVNAQKRFSDAPLKTLAEKLRRKWRVDFEVSASEPVGLGGAKSVREKFAAASAVIVTDLDATAPALVVLPDARCSIINTAAFPADATEGLLRKEVARGFAACSGALTSQREPSIMRPFDNLKALDAQASDAVPVDVAMKAFTVLQDFGLKPHKTTTYRQACAEGWAPAPTNDVLKAIWDEVHTPPTAPLEIKYDAKAGAGKIIQKK